MLVAGHALRVVDRQAVAIGQLDAPGSLVGERIPGHEADFTGLAFQIDALGSDAGHVENRGVVADVSDGPGFKPGMGPGEQADAVARGKLKVVRRAGAVRGLLDHPALDASPGPYGAADGK